MSIELGYFWCVRLVGKHMNGAKRGCAAFRYLGAVLVSILLTAVGPRASAQPPAVEAFAELPAMQSPSLSPDGARLAFITHNRDNSYIVVSSLEDMSVTVIVQPTNVKLRSVFWGNEEALVFTASTTLNPMLIPGQVEATSPYVVDISGEPVVTPLFRDRPPPRGGAAVIGGAVAIDGAQLIGFDRRSGSVLYPRFDTSREERVLYAIDPKDGRQRVVDRGSRFTRDWVVDQRGEPIFRADYTEASDRYILLSHRTGRWETLISQAVEIPQLSIYGLSIDSDALIVGTRRERDGRYALHALSMETGELGAPVLAHPRYDVGRAVTDPYTNRVVGGIVMGLGVEWFDAALAEQQALMDDAFPGESPALVSWSEDRSRFIVTTEAPDRAPAVYLYDARAESVNQIASIYTGLQGVSLPPRRDYTYTARDGTDIPAYLTRPLDAVGPTPLIVLPHGGPAARDVAGFDWLAHFFASRGYTVLQPNFRGSTGFGGAWEEAGYGEWGIGVMQHDLTDGALALIEAGIADAERVCLVGTSYGGYAALAGAVFTPDLYRCAAAFAPVTELADMLSFERGRSGERSATVSYWRRAMGVGDPAGRDDRLRAASPAAHAERVQAPILLVHGREDSVVPIEQSRAMERALRDAGKDVELLELDGEDHWLSGASTRLAVLHAFDEFLAAHLAD